MYGWWGRDGDMVNGKKGSGARQRGAECRAMGRFKGLFFDNPTIIGCLLVVKLRVSFPPSMVVQTRDEIQAFEMLMGFKCFLFFFSKTYQQRRQTDGIQP